VKRFERVGRLAVLLGFSGILPEVGTPLRTLGAPVRFWDPIVYLGTGFPPLGEIPCAWGFISTVLVWRNGGFILETRFFTPHGLRGPRGGETGKGQMVAQTQGLGPGLGGGGKNTPPG